MTEKEKALQRQFEPVCNLAQVIASSHALEILLLLVTAPRATGAIAEALSLDPSLISHVLPRLVATGFVAGQRRGRNSVYSTTDCVVLRQDGSLELLWSGLAVRIEPGHATPTARKVHVTRVTG